MCFNNVQASNVWLNLHKPLEAFGHLFKFKFCDYEMGSSYKE